MFFFVIVTQNVGHQRFGLGKGKNPTPPDQNAETLTNIGHVENVSPSHKSTK